MRIHLVGVGTNTGTGGICLKFPNSITLGDFIQMLSATNFFFCFAVSVWREAQRCLLFNGEAVTCKYVGRKILPE